MVAPKDAAHALKTGTAAPVAAKDVVAIVVRIATAQAKTGQSNKVRLTPAMQAQTTSL